MIKKFILYILYDRLITLFKGSDKRKGDYPGNNNDYNFYGNTFNSYSSFWDSVVTLFVTGGLLSFDKFTNRLTLTIHALTFIVTAFSTIMALYLLNR
jgi:hypothetical protein